MRSHAVRTHARAFAPARRAAPMHPPRLRARGARARAREVADDPSHRGSESPDPRYSLQAPSRNSLQAPSHRIHARARLAGGRRPTIGRSPALGGGGGQLSESAVGTSRPSQSSGSVTRVHRPCLSSESAAPANRPERLMTSSPNRVSTSDERKEPTPQPTNGTVLVMPVLSPVIRPVDPRCLTHRKSPRTVSASQIFDTNDPLQDPTRKRQIAPQARGDDLWTQWRNLARDGRRNTCSTPSI
jgi:hypothetical protein